MRLEWQYWLDDALTVREACIEVIGVHHEVAIRTRLRSAYVENDQRFDLAVDLRVTGPAERRGDRSTGHPWLTASTQIHTTWREITTKTDGVDASGWEGLHVEEWFFFEPA